MEITIYLIGLVLAAQARGEDLFPFMDLDVAARRSIISFYFLSYIFGFIDRIAKAMGLYTLSKFLDREAFFSYNSRQMIGHASVTVEYMR